MFNSNNCIYSKNGNISLQDGEETKRKQAKGSDVMATSSIEKEVVILTEKQAEQLLDAIEESQRKQRESE